MTEQARSFHRAAEEYERGRPGWPASLLDLLPVAEGATEIARVLRPGGVLARCWNESIEPSPLPAGYRRRLEELYEALKPPPVPDDLFDGAPFGEAHAGAVEHEQVSSRDDVLAFAASVSWIASREDRDEVLAELASLLPEGEYRFPLRANVEWATRS